MENMGFGWPVGFWSRYSLWCEICIDLLFYFILDLDLDLFVFCVYVSAACIYLCACEWCLSGWVSVFFSFTLVFSGLVARVCLLSFNLVLGLGKKDLFYS